MAVGKSTRLKALEEDLASVERVLAGFRKNKAGWTKTLGKTNYDAHIKKFTSMIKTKKELIKKEKAKK